MIYYKGYGRLSKLVSAATAKRLCTYGKIRKDQRNTVVPLICVGYVPRPPVGF